MLLKKSEKSFGRFCLSSGRQLNGSDPDRCIVDSNCKVYGFRNLFVCDASVFPTAVGVNPQMNVMALASIISDRIDKKWDDFVPE